MPSYRDLDYDVVVVGAGVTGLYQLHCLRKLGFRVRVLEAGSDVGVHGIGTGILGVALIRKVTPTRIHFLKSY